MKKIYVVKEKCSFNDLENKESKNVNKKPTLGSYRFSSEKKNINELSELKTEYENKKINLTSLYKNINKPNPITLKQNYIEYKNNKILNINTKAKNISSSNYNNCLTDTNIFWNNRNKEEIKSVCNSKDDIVKHNLSKEKSCYSFNFTNNTNANSNTYYNNTPTSNNNKNPINSEKEKNLSNLIKTNDEELNITNNSISINNANNKELSPISPGKINKANNSNKVIKSKNKLDRSKSNISLERNSPLSSYYSLKDDLMKKRQRDYLLSESRKFYYYNNDRGILNKIKKLKYKDTEKEEKENGLYFYDKKQIRIYSGVKRIPTQICFSKGISSFKNNQEELEIYLKYNDKYVNNLMKKNDNRGDNEKKINNYYKLITKGFPKNEFKNFNIYEHKLIINSRKRKKFQKNKDLFGNDIYPLINQKKILKNIIKKPLDYNTKISIMSILNNEIHAFKRFQSKILNHSSKLISHEIDFLFCQNFKLTDIYVPLKIYQNADEYAQCKTNEKFNNLLENILKTIDKEKITKNKINEKVLKLIHRKFLLEKFIITIKLCMIKFKRLQISLDFLLEIIFHDKPNPYKDGIYFFNLIKDGDIKKIETEIKNNYKLASFKDEFNQTPLHICAKRNIYQVVKLLVSRLANVNAKDMYERTPLMCAANAGHMEIVCILLFSFANPNIEDKEKKKASDYAKNDRIQYALKFAEVIHIFNTLYNSMKNFDIFVLRGLRHLFGKELGLNFEPWLEINDKIFKQNGEM